MQITTLNINIFYTIGLQITEFYHIKILFLQHKYKNKQNKSAFISHNYF